MPSVKSLRFLQTFAVLIALHAFLPDIRADVRLPAIFSDHMVLQAGVQVPVWGWAEPGEEVTVSIGQQTKKTKAASDGKWMVKLGKLKTGDTGTLTVKGKNNITVQDVIVGEVWLCSGQSNMAMTVDRSKNFDEEKAAANFSRIRMFTVARNPQDVPQADCTGSWVVCSPETVGAFSAAGYFFGREIHQKIGAPVGLINSSFGGTPVEAWTSMEAQSKLADYKTIAEPWLAASQPWDEAKAMAAFNKQTAAWKKKAAKARAEGKQPPAAPLKPTSPRLNKNYPANLFNGMIAPLIPYALRGSIWYQGENNASKEFANLYGLQLATMIKDWRARWGYDFPFAWVQLPDFHAPQKEVVEPTGWTTIREEMLKTLSVPKTGMAITIGLGEANNIHPKDKQEVGRRLAMWALADQNKQKGIASSGPLPAGNKIKGDKIIVSFKHTDGGLVAKDGELKGFALAGEDQKWVRASARIEGNKVIVFSSEVKQPVAVRYAWADNPEFNLYNGAGIPATPFRTDNWK